MEHVLERTLVYLQVRAGFLGLSHPPFDGPGIHCQALLLGVLRINVGVKIARDFVNGIGILWNRGVNQEPILHWDQIQRHQWTR